MERPFLAAVRSVRKADGDSIAPPTHDPMAIENELHSISSSSERSYPDRTTPESLTHRECQRPVPPLLAPGHILGDEESIAHIAQTTDILLTSRENINIGTCRRIVESGWPGLLDSDCNLLSNAVYAAVGVALQRAGQPSHLNHRVRDCTPVMEKTARPTLATADVGDPWKLVVVDVDVETTVTSPRLMPNDPRAARRSMPRIMPSGLEESRIGFVSTLRKSGGTSVKKDGTEQDLPTVDEVVAGEWDPPSPPTPPPLTLQQRAAARSTLSDTAVCPTERIDSSNEGVAVPQSSLSTISVHGADQSECGRQSPTAAENAPQSESHVDPFSVDFGAGTVYDFLDMATPLQDEPMEWFSVIQECAFSPTLGVVTAYQPLTELVSPYDAVKETAPAVELPECAKLTRRNLTYWKSRRPQQ